MTNEQWKAIINNDKSYDGVFFYGVKTTNRICKPSCPARTCKRENAVIFTSYAEGIDAGYKPCARCRPESPNWQGAKYELAKKAERYIETHYREKFSLKQISADLYINSHYLVRAFKEVNGFTLLWFHNKVRCSHAADLLKRSSQSITYVSDTTGFVNPSHFARVFKAYYNMSPGEYRKAYYKKL